MSFDWKGTNGDLLCPNCARVVSQGTIRCISCGADLTHVSRRLHSTSGPNLLYLALGLSVPVLLLCHYMRLSVQPGLPDRQVQIVDAYNAASATAKAMYDRGCEKMNQRKYKEAIEDFNQSL